MSQLQPEHRGHGSGRGFSREGPRSHPAKHPASERFRSTEPNHTQDNATVRQKSPSLRSSLHRNRIRHFGTARESFGFHNITSTKKLPNETEAGGEHWATLGKNRVLASVVQSYNLSLPTEKMHTSYLMHVFLLLPGTSPEDNRLTRVGIKNTRSDQLCRGAMGKTAKERTRHSPSCTRGSCGHTQHMQSSL